MVDMGMDAYRFSIAWSRIYPSTFFYLLKKCTVNLVEFMMNISQRIFIKLMFFYSLLVTLDGTGKINQAGIDHYNKLINALLAKGMVEIVLSRIKY